jgi:hypothetical protein
MMWWVSSRRLLQRLRVSFRNRDLKGRACCFYTIEKYACLPASDPCRTPWSIASNSPAWRSSVPRSEYQQKVCPCHISPRVAWLDSTLLCQADSATKARTSNSSQTWRSSRQLAFLGEVGGHVWGMKDFVSMIHLRGKVFDPIWKRILTKMDCSYHFRMQSIKLQYDEFTSCGWLIRLILSSSIVFPEEAFAQPLAPSNSEIHPYGFI